MTGRHIPAEMLRRARRLSHGDLRDVPDLLLTPGGWLAVAVDSPLIAVTGETAADALVRFREARTKWRKLIMLAKEERDADLLGSES